MTQGDLETLVTRAIVRRTVMPATTGARASGAEIRDLRPRIEEALGSSEFGPLVEAIRSCNDWDENPQLCYTLGTALVAAGQPEEAERVLARTLTICAEDDPLLAAAHSSLACAELARGRLDEAAERIDRACAVAPELACAQHNRIVIASKTESPERIDQAIRALADSYPEWPEDSELMHGLRTDADLAFARTTRAWIEVIEPQLPR